MKKSFFKRGTSALLAVIMCFSAFLGIGSTTAFAAEGTTDEVVMFSFPREGDANIGGDWGHDELRYMNGWSAASTKKITVYTIGSWSGNACYCIEPGTPLNIGDVMTERDENYWDNYPSTYNKTISADEIKLFIGRIFQYGYTGKVDIDWRSQNSADADKMAHIMATQTLIWETVVGERDSNFNHVDTGSYDAVNDRVSKSHPLYSQYISYYNSMVSNVQKHSKVPSFFAKSTSKAQDIELEWNGTNYSTTLTDTNNVLGNYSFTASESGINFSVSGNKLTITANKAPTSKVNITATKNGSVRKGVVVWSDGKYAPGSGIQDLSTFAAEVNDPVRGYLNIKVSLGSAKIVKTSEDGNVSGISFTITGNGVNKTVKTGSNGEIVIDNLSPGTYTVTEQSIGYYEPQQSKTVTVVSGQTASVSFKNVLKRSDLKVIKTSEDNMNEGVKFHLYGKSTSGQTVDLFATTDKSGVAMFKNVLVGTNYTLEEVETAERYIIPDSQVAVIEWEKVTENDFYNELKRGDLKVVKTSEDNMVEGIKFHLYGTSLSGHKVDEYAVTDKNGVAMFEDVLIGSRYTLEEVNTAEKYIVPKAQTVEIEWNKVVNKSFENILKRGDLKVVKTAEDKLVEGLKFHLYGTSLSGIKVDEYATTDKNGVATFKNILIGSNFTIEEVNTPIRYVIPESQSAVIEWNKVTEKSFENILKKWRADVYKLDSELADKNGGSGVPIKLVDGDSDEMIEKLGGAYGKAQGDATLGGAVYGVYKGETLVDTYTTDENGYFITDYYVCGDDWSIREITPSEGYLLDTTIYHIDCSAENYTVELNTEYPDVYENIIKGNIAIIKHTDDGSTKIETPEEGAKFEIFLKAAGSYKNAKETERDVIVCDEHGFGQTKMLPYGVYTVHQVSGWDGRELMPDFEVYIAQHETTYRYLINNANFESYVRVVKVDAETEKTIPYAGAAFKIYNPDGELVKMTFTYPTPTTIDTFYTDANGSLVTPEKLPYGKGYYLVEVEAPFGYVLDTTPVYFDVTEDNSTTEESGVTVIKVNKANMAQKGTVTVEKNGEVFFGVDVSGDENTVIYQPIYKETALEGAVFEIRAAEDIYTPDGTLRYAKGEVVDTITTGADGLAKSKEIYLGKYEVQEIKAPYGYVISQDIHSVELIYAGQNVSVTETATSFYNERQKATLSMQKVLETNDLFEIGNNGEIKNVVFGLYAAEELVSTSGTSIPVDGLIEVITFDENGLATVKTDLPLGSYYVKEIATDEHYILNSDKYEFAFEYEGQEIVAVTLSVNGGKPIENDLIYGSVEGMKTTEHGYSLAGAVIGLFKKDETNFTKDTALMTTTSAEDGSFSFANIPYGEWVVREIEQPIGFVLNETVFDVVIKENAQIVKIEIVNEFIMGDITLTKVDKEYPDNKLSGATFEVYKDNNADGVIDEGDELIGTLTEKDGVYEMLDLYYGHYLVKETVAPEGFLLDDGVYAVFIDTDENVYVIENEAGVGFINKPIKGNITLTKVDKEYPDNKLSGATFEVYKDNNADGKLDGGDTLIGTLTESEVGIYEMKDMRYGHYLIKETVAPDGFFLDEGVYAVFIETDGTTYVVENEAGVGFINNAMTGTLKIVKTSSDGKVEGFSFRITGPNGFDVTLKTDKNGEIFLEGLRIGEYTVSEVADDVSAPYSRPGDKKANVMTDSTTIVEMHNVFIDNPKTGDDSNIGLWLGLLGLSVVGIGATVFFGFRRKKKDGEQ